MEKRAGKAVSDNADNGLLMIQSREVLHYLGRHGNWGDRKKQWIVGDKPVSANKMAVSFRDRGVDDFRAKVGKLCTAYSSPLHTRCPNCD
jgi:hypothetical protein